MSPLIHRVVRVVCLAGAATAPVIAALVCRFVARYAVKHIFPALDGAALPAITEMWVLQLAEGTLPLRSIGFLLFMGSAAIGGYAVFSKRLTSQASGSILALVCCVSYATALVMLGNTLLAVTLPFLPSGSN